MAPGLVSPEVRIPAERLWRRPIGDALGGQAAVSYWDWDSGRDDYSLIEQRTTLNVRADFTEQVSAFIEIESYAIWGEDFRSEDYITGVDTRGEADFSPEIYQAYIEANEMFGLPLRLRVGRQELSLGSGWLVGNNSALPEFPGLSFDGVRLTWTYDLFSIDVFTMKNFEETGTGAGGDIDFSGVYGRLTAMDELTVDAYWLWVRDNREVEEVAGGYFQERLEDWWGVDGHDRTNLHTVGLRIFGEASGFDYDAEAAYQFGDAGQAGTLFRTVRYGDDDARFNAWGAHIEAGYTFDVPTRPRVHVRGAYFGGRDNRDLSFAEWINPFNRPDSSVSFNRLFSNRAYSVFFDEMGQLSNAWTLGGGVSLAPIEELELALTAAYFGVVERFDRPRSINVADLEIPIAGPLTFWTKKSGSDLGWDLNLSAVYHYSEDLDFKAGWSHLFTGEGLAEGNYTDFNGLLFSGGTDDSDADYFYAETSIRF